MTTRHRDIRHGLPRISIPYTVDCVAGGYLITTKPAGAHRHKAKRTKAEHGDLVAGANDKK